MFLEGEVNWVLWLGLLAAITTVFAIVAGVAAATGRARHVSAADRLDVVSKEAAAANRRLLETLHAIPVALVQTDRQGKFVFANRAAHDLLGRRDAELLGLRFHSATWGITYPDGKPAPADLLPSARALRGQTVRGFPLAMVNAATRRKMLVSVTAMPIENERGDVIGSTAAIVETEALTTPDPEPWPESRPESRPQPETGSAVEGGAPDSLTRRVFDAAASALVVLGDDGRVAEANPVALDLTGLTAAGVLGADFADLFLSEDRRAEGRQALRAAAAATPGDAEPFEDPARAVVWRILPLPGGEAARPALLLAGERAAARPVAAGPAAAAAPPAESDSASEDVSAEAAARLAERVAEQAAEQAAELAAERDAALAGAAQALEDARLARAEAAEARALAEAELAGGRRMENVGRLTGGVAHDFNALLGVMTSALDMILRQADDPARVRRLGRAALTAGRRGEDLTRRLAVFSQGGDDAPALQVLDVGQLLAGMEARLRDLAGPGVDLMVETPAEPALARVDPVAFEGAVRALATNAVEAVEGRGSVAVRLQALIEGGLRLSVRDSGPGMDRDLAVRAQEPFFTTKPGAAGLGLSQAYAFARQSSGTLSIDSGPGEGAEVAITLPVAG